MLEAWVIELGLAVTLMPTYAAVRYVQLRRTRPRAKVVMSPKQKEFWDTITVEELADKVQFDSNGVPYLPTDVDQPYRPADPMKSVEAAKPVGPLTKYQHREYLKERGFDPDRFGTKGGSSTHYTLVDAESGQTTRIPRYLDETQPEEPQHGDVRWNQVKRWQEYFNAKTKTWQTVNPLRDPRLDIAACRCGAPYVRGAFTCNCPHPGLTPENPDADNSLGFGTTVDGFDGLQEYYEKRDHPRKKRQENPYAGLTPAEDMSRIPIQKKPRTPRKNKKNPGDIPPPPPKGIKRLR